MNQVSTAHGPREGIMRVEDGFRQVSEQIRRADDRLVRFARQKPLAAAFAALAVGFLVGRLVTRR
jgi:ElaB/YqjD/DUF883 family membrane-anchored ribosome-binding protein